MESELFDEIADKILVKLPKINKVLSHCGELDSKLSNDSTKVECEDIFSINTNDVVMKQRSSKRLNLSNIAAMVKKLEINAKSNDGLKKKTRSESINSLASDDNNKDYMTELKNQLKEAKKILEIIKNSNIEMYNEDSCLKNVIEENNKFLEFVFGIQRIVREMTTIASTDDIPSVSSSFSFMDNSFIDQLRQLEKCIGEMQKLDENKNPIVNLERKSDLKMECTRTINNILEVIDKNPL